MTSPLQQDGTEPLPPTTFRLTEAGREIVSISPEGNVRVAADASPEELGIALNYALRELWNRRERRDPSPAPATVEWLRDRGRDAIRLDWMHSHVVAITTRDSDGEEYEWRTDIYHRDEEPIREALDRIAKEVAELAGATSTPEGGRTNGG